MNIIIRIFIIFHLATVGLVCVNGLAENLKANDQPLNDYGSIFLQKIDFKFYHLKVFDALSFYARCTGVNHGYSYFSPNVPHVKRDIYFLDNGVKLIEPSTKYFETNFKYSAFKTSLFKDIFSYDDRDDYIRSLGSHLMTAYGSDCIDAYITYRVFNGIEEATIDDTIQEEDQVHVFTLLKNKS